MPECGPELLKQLANHHWSGNVRELRNVAERMVLLADENIQNLAELCPSETRPSGAGGAGSIQFRQPEAGALFHSMVREGEVFWDVVHAPFLSRDLTRAQVRQVIREGLEVTGGNYKQLVELFNMPLGDYKRFLSFLRKHNYQLPFQAFRAGVFRDMTHAANVAHPG